MKTDRWSMRVWGKHGLDLAWAVFIVVMTIGTAALVSYIFASVLGEADERPPLAESRCDVGVFKKTLQSTGEHCLVRHAGTDASVRSEDLIDCFKTRELLDKMCENIREGKCTQVSP